MKYFLAELRRRHIFRFAAAYLVVAWVMAQVADLVLPTFGAPDWGVRFFILLEALALPAVLVAAWAARAPAEPGKLEPAAPPKLQTADGILIGLLVLVLGMSVYQSLQPAPDGGTARARTAAVLATDVSPRQSIAVLPFTNMSGDPANEYFADGMSEELLNVLARMPELRVAARTSSFVFKGRNEPVQRVADELNVAHIVEGSVRKSGEQVRITVQLIDARSGYHIWSQTYDRKLTDIFQVQDEISDAVVAALSDYLNLGKPAASPPDRKITINPEAYNYYLLGRHEVDRRRKNSLQEAVKQFTKALELDPDFAPAHVGLAEATLLLMKSESTYGDLTLDEVRKRAEPHIETALRLDPQSAAAYAARGLLMYNSGKSEAAERALRKAVELNPNLARARMWLSLVLGAQGRDDEALRELETAIDLDPLSIPANTNLTDIYLARGRIKEAAALALRMRKFHSDHSYGYVASARLHHVRGKLVPAAMTLKELLSRFPNDPKVTNALTDVLMDLKAFKEAQAWLPEMRPDLLVATGRIAEARNFVHKQMKQEPGEKEGIKVVAAYVDLFAGDNAAARKTLEEIAQTTKDGEGVLFKLHAGLIPALTLAYLRREAGDAKGAERLIRQSEEQIRYMAARGARHGIFLYVRARMAMLQGRPDDALTDLRAAFAGGWRGWYLDFDPLFAPLRDDPAFVTFRKTLEADLAKQRAELRSQL